MNQQKHHRHRPRRRWERMSERDTISIEPQAWCEMNGCPPAPFTYLSGCQTRWWAPQILRSSDHNWRSHPSVCHQHTTENPSRSQPKAFHTTCKNNFGRWSSTPKTRELYFNLTRTSIIRRVLKFNVMINSSYLSSLTFVKSVCSWWNRAFRRP